MELSGVCFREIHSTQLDACQLWENKCQSHLANEWRWENNTSVHLPVYMTQNGLKNNPQQTENKKQDTQHKGIDWTRKDLKDSNKQPRMIWETKTKPRRIMRSAPYGRKEWISPCCFLTSFSAEVFASVLLPSVSPFIRGRCERTQMEVVKVYRWPAWTVKFLTFLAASQRVSCTQCSQD